MKSIASLLSIIALGLGLLSCSGGGGGNGGGTSATPTTTANFGVVGNSYFSSLPTNTSTTLTPPVTWTVLGGIPLPAGLLLTSATGAVTGTPTVAGNSTVTFLATEFSTGKTETYSVLFAIHPRTDPISLDSNGTAGNGASSQPTISADGRLIAFTSLATTLAPTPNGSGTQIFVYDRQTGQPSLVSINNVGNAGNGASSQPTISADGRFVAFTSLATTLAPTPNGSGTQIFLRDTQTNTTTLVSQDAVGNAGNGDSSQPAISADGRFVAFTSLATMAPIPGGSGTQIFLRDTQTNTTTLVSRIGLGNAGDGDSSQPTISSNGQFVAFTSAALNLALIPGGSGTQIFLRDTQTNTTSLVSRDTGGNAGNGASSQPTISSNGQFVAFTSSASTLTGDPDPSPSQIFLRDTVGNGTSLVSKDNSSPPVPGGGPSDTPSVNADGGFVAFSSLSTNLGLPGGNQQIYVRAMP